VLLLLVAVTVANVPPPLDNNVDNNVFTSTVNSGPTFVLGDVRGNVNVLLQALRLADLIEDDEVHWIGGNANFVFLGRMLYNPDDDAASLALLGTLVKLRSEAELAGGTVTTVLTLDTVEILQRQGAVPKWLSASTDTGRLVRSSKLVAVTPGRHPLLGTYGGISRLMLERWAKLWGQPPLPAEISDKDVVTMAHRVNEDVSLFLNGTVTTMNPVVKAVLVPLLLDDPLSPLTYSVFRATDLCRVVGQLNLAAARIAVGHSPFQYPKYSYCGALLYALDFAGSGPKRATPPSSTPLSQAPPPVVAILSYNTFTGHGELITNARSRPAPMRYYMYWSFMAVGAAASSILTARLVWYCLGYGSTTPEKGARRYYVKRYGTADTNPPKSGQEDVA